MEFQLGFEFGNAGILPGYRLSIENLAAFELGNLRPQINKFNGLGGSLFDALMQRWRAEGRGTVPYPFSNLVAALRPLAGVDAGGGAVRPADT